jgi:hypothetical protein
MIFNDVKAEHLGGGVVVFRDAIRLDWEYANRISKEIVNREMGDMYQPAINPDNGLEEYVNRSGYFFSKNGIDKMPKRGSRVHQDTRPEVVELFTFIEECKDKYLFRYMHMFPLVFKNIWWKVKGHLVSYSSDCGGYIGEHSDTSVDYVYGLPHPPHQLASRNTLSCLVYFGNCVDGSELSEPGDFTGGHHRFTYLNIDYTPRRGDILMFPSNYMAAHEVTPVSSGERFTYLGWYAHGTPNPAVNEEVEDPVVNPDKAAVSSNVYIPHLREKFLEYLDSVGEDKSSKTYRLTMGEHA